MKKQGETAYRLAVQGMTWAAVADALHLPSASAACGRAREWALLHEQPWPLKREQVSTSKLKRQEAYRLALGGRTWNEVAELLGYSCLEAAMRAARAHARRVGAAWQIRPNAGIAYEIRAPLLEVLAEYGPCSAHEVHEMLEQRGAVKTQKQTHGAIYRAVLAGDVVRIGPRGRSRYVLAG